MELGNLDGPVDNIHQYIYPVITKKMLFFCTYTVYSNLAP